MQFGISTSCFYPALTEWAVRILAQEKVPATEVFLNSFSELDPSYLRQQKNMLDYGGTRVLSVHPFTCGLEPMLFFGDYRRRFEDGVELYKRYYEAAAELGAQYFVLHGDRKEGTLPDEAYFERFAELDAVGRPYGVRLAQENVARCRSGKLSFLKKMKQALPDAAFVLDVKQARRSGEDWREIVDVLGGSLRHVHISGASAEKDCLSLLEGDFPLEEFLGALKKNGFAGGVILELYRQNYGGYGELMESLHKMEQAAAQLEK